MVNVAEERLRAVTWTINQVEELIRCTSDTRVRLQWLFELWELRTERLKLLRVLHPGR